MSAILAAVLLAQVTETITVTATRTETRVADTPASVVVLSRETLETTAAPTLDDALRQVAGFTLFRRSGSRVANPTSQGVTLRGVGASGASRALVLDDGVPLNDPFGGWIYWGRVPRAALDRVEVLRGGASDLYGSSAMGGVVQFIRRRSGALTFDASAGSQSTGTASIFSSAQRGEWNGSIAVDAFHTGGFTLVRPEERGAVDVDADSRHATIDATVRRSGAFLRASYYSESRNNGTPLQKNDTENRSVAAGADWSALGGTVAFRAFASDQDYFQTFSAIDAARASERLTIEQSVPSRGAGATAQYTRAFAGKHVLVAGTELRGARGSSDELRFNANGSTFRVSAGGKQENLAAYVEDLFAITSALSITAGVRGDLVRNDGEDLRTSEGQFNPRLSVLWRANDAFSFSASAYSAFRAATLNELYRGFRVGNVNTLPNAALKSENLTGFELGARARNARLTLFLTDVSDTIANVTHSQTPTLITRQRQNLGRTRSVGAELDAEWRLGKEWRTSVSGLLVDATVRDGALRGNRLPQVPRAQATAQLMWKRIGAQLRWSSMQFDDDRNELPLDSYFVADLFASHPLTRALDLTLAIENITNTDVEVGATPVITHGQPRALRLGVRYSR
ncbi:MAG: TonB-dependent receptor [Acidobacteriota bacterium]|nr:TonB-dependent receptor [Acidobacteriota bacterium]